MSQLQSLLSENATGSHTTSSPSMKSFEMTERKRIIEFLELFRELPYLWDPNHVDYTNQDQRRHGYEILRQKYKTYQCDATIASTKKKIEYLRTSYRRQRKKVLSSHLKYGQEIRPSLWYYDHMRFLDAVKDNGNITTEDDKDDVDVKVVKRPKREKLTSIFVTEEDHNHEQDSEGCDVTAEDADVIDDTNNSYIIDENKETSSMITEAEAFGRTIGLQLNEMEAEQKYIAEKLISDVIFHGRFKKLNITTRLNNISI